MSTTHFDVLIIGRGLAGAVLAEVLEQRGMRVAVFDSDEAHSASHVAIGMVNPVVLRRLVLSWRAAEFLRIAEGFYADMERRYGMKLWHPVPLLRVHANEQEAAFWLKRSAEPEVGPFVSSANNGLPSDLASKFGVGRIEHAAWLDVNAFIGAQGKRLGDECGLFSKRVVDEDVVRTDQGFTIHGVHAKQVIWCTGAHKAIPGLIPVRGEGLTLHIPGIGLKQALDRGGLLLPIGEDRYRIGSTFAWDDVWSGPTEDGKAELLARLKRITERPYDVIAHWAGIRPTTKDRRPILGRSPDRPGETIFNGLGTRGVLQAPWCADHLARHLFDGSPLDPEVDGLRFHG